MPQLSLALPVSDATDPGDAVSPADLDHRPRGDIVAENDHFPPELVRLCAMATRVLNEHTNDHDLCAVCGCAWPCARAQLAEHNLAFL